MTCKGSGKTRTRNMRQRSRRLGKEIDVSPFNLSAFRENHSQNETFLSWSTGWYSKRETTLKAKILTHLNRYVGFSEFQLNKNNNRIKYWCVPVWDSVPYVPYVIRIVCLPRRAHTSQINLFSLTKSLTHHRRTRIISHFYLLCDVVGVLTITLWVRQKCNVTIIILITYLFKCSHQNIGKYGDKNIFKALSYK